MSDLKLRWWQAKILKEQIDATLEAQKLGPTGKLTMDNGAIVEWDTTNVKLEIPEELDAELKEYCS